MTIQTACFDCSKYQDGDDWARLLAHFCILPYAILLCQGAVAYSSRDLHYVTLFGGGCINAVLSKVLKRLFRQPRPSTMCAILGNCSQGQFSVAAQANQSIKT
ncbi:hypothetical protein WJX73_004884 [Symbiochloris irregularis]|uniref:Uncharacterized protein n=1 Tax=Symbiochloris irregularis TaxID=706552 RepID=A0AAW1PND5_9CHLO